MNEDISLLKKEFFRIKKMGLVKSLRKGGTGIGYTFETLLNKKEDKECKPDFGSVEIKCRMGYGKKEINLFTCAPSRDDVLATNYIFQKYSYHRYGNYNDYRLFLRKVFVKSEYKESYHEFKLVIDYDNKKIIMKSFDHSNNFIEDVCYWTFYELETKLITKLTTLAIVKGYPYIREKETYYKYTNIDFYKLKGFDTFLKLIEDDKIYIAIYLREGLNKLGDQIIENHGVTFRLKFEYLNELFDKIYC